MKGLTVKTSDEPVPVQVVFSPECQNYLFKIECAQRQSCILSEVDLRKLHNAYFEL